MASGFDESVAKLKEYTAEVDKAIVAVDQHDGNIDAAETGLASLEGMAETTLSSVDSDLDSFRDGVDDKADDAVEAIEAVTKAAGDIAGELEDATERVGDVEISLTRAADRVERDLRDNLGTLTEGGFQELEGDLAAVQQALVRADGQLETAFTEVDTALPPMGTSFEKAIDDTEGKVVQATQEAAGELVTLQGSVADFATAMEAQQGEFIATAEAAADAAEQGYEELNQDAQTAGEGLYEVVRAMLVGMRDEQVVEREADLAEPVDDILVAVAGAYLEELDELSDDTLRSLDAQAQRVKNLVPKLEAALRQFPGSRRSSTRLGTKDHDDPGRQLRRAQQGRTHHPGQGGRDRQAGEGVRGVRPGLRDLPGRASRRRRRPHGKHPQGPGRPQGAGGRRERPAGRRRQGGAGCGDEVPRKGDGGGGPAGGEGGSSGNGHGVAEGQAGRGRGSGQGAASGGRGKARGPCRSAERLRRQAAGGSGRATRAADELEDEVADAGKKIAKALEQLRTQIQQISGTTPGHVDRAGQYLEKLFSEHKGNAQEPLGVLESKNGELVGDLDQRLGEQSERLKDGMQEVSEALADVGQAVMEATEASREARPPIEEQTAQLEQTIEPVVWGTMAVERAAESTGLWLVLRLSPDSARRAQGGPESGGAGRRGEGAGQQVGGLPGDRGRGAGRPRGRRQGR